MRKKKKSSRWPPPALRCRGGLLGNVCPQGMLELMVRLFRRVDEADFLRLSVGCPLGQELFLQAARLTSAGFRMTPPPQLLPQATEPSQAEWWKLAVLASRSDQDLIRTARRTHTKIDRNKRLSVMQAHMERLLKRKLSHVDREALWFFVTELVVYRQAGADDFLVPPPQLISTTWAKRASGVFALISIAASPEALGPQPELVPTPPDLEKDAEERHCIRGKDLPFVALTIDPVVFGEAVLDMIVDKSYAEAFLSCTFDDRSERPSEQGLPPRAASLPLGLGGSVTRRRTSSRREVAEHLIFPTSPRLLDSASLPTERPERVPSSMWKELLQLLENVDLDLSEIHLKYLVYTLTAAVALDRESIHTLHANLLSGGLEDDGRRLLVSTWLDQYTLFSESLSRVCLFFIHQWLSVVDNDEGEALESIWHECCPLVVDNVSKRTYANSSEELLVLQDLFIILSDLTFRIDDGARRKMTQR